MISDVTSALSQATISKLMEINQSPMDPLVEALCEIVPSTAEFETYPWVGEVAQLSEKKKGQPVHVEQLTSKSMVKYNKVYATAVEFAKEDLKNDKAGAIARRMSQAMNQIQRLPRSLLISAFTDSLNLGFDGVTFFSNSHPDRGGGAMDNIIAGGGVTTADILDDIADAMETVMGFKQEGGEYHQEEIMNVVIVYPPGLSQAMKEATSASIISNTSNALISGLSIKAFPSARLSDANDWYFFTTDVQKPFYLQVRDGFRSEVYENAKEQVEGTLLMWDGCLAPGHWARGVKITNT